MSARRPSATSPLDARHSLDGGVSSVLDRMAAAVLIVDRSGDVLLRNAAARASLPAGNGLAEVLRGLRWFAAFDGWPAELAPVFELGTARRWGGLIPPAGRAGAKVACVHSGPWLTPGSRETQAAWVLITEDVGQQASEASTDVQRRLAALGRLAARVAHELNNPLDGILRYVNLALRLADETPAPKLKAYLSESRTGLMRMVQIIGDLLEYARGKDANVDDMGVGKVVEQVIKDAAPAADAAGVVMTLEVQSEDLPRVRGSRLHQVLANLVRNAIDAMPTGGRLTITTGLADQRVVIRFADTGPGLQDPVDRVFEPFYTTKPPGKGSGLGLAVCKEFVDDMQGTISAQNDARGGAVLTVRIPLSSFISEPPAGPSNIP